MTWGFEKDRVYNRRADIHARFGGQQQGGIITPAAHALVIVITGDQGRQHGYADRLREDGVFEYFGEGQTGDMEWVRGNRTVRFHSAEGRSLLLFRKEKAGLRFIGEMVYVDHHITRAPDRDGNLRDAIVFELHGLEAINEAVENDGEQAGGVDNGVLRKLAYSAAGFEPLPKGQTLRNIYQRSADVSRYVLARANGSCEGCGAPAPFERKDGSPYLEPHHIRRVSDGGPDHPAFVIALCPNCHRRVHAGVDGAAYNDTLRDLMASIEPPYRH